MEHALHADFAFVKAWKGDTMGNLYFRKTTRNFSTSMARAANITIAEVEHLVNARRNRCRSVFTCRCVCKAYLPGQQLRKTNRKKNNPHQLTTIIIPAATPYSAVVASHTCTAALNATMQIHLLQILLPACSLNPYF